jgi:hypothetical protein
VIDEFVYDPSSNAGKLGARVTKGVFRFISGKIAHENPQDMELKLPSGTLGVRGTMVAGRVDETAKSSRLVLLGEGPENDTGAPQRLRSVQRGKCASIDRATATIDGPDSPPVRPFRFSPEDRRAHTVNVDRRLDRDGDIGNGGTRRHSGSGNQAPMATRARRPRSPGSRGRATGNGNDENRLRTLEGSTRPAPTSASSGQSVEVNGRVGFRWIAATQQLPGFDPFLDSAPVLPAREITTTKEHARGELSAKAVYQRSGSGSGLNGQPAGIYGSVNLARGRRLAVST